MNPIVWISIIVILIIELWLLFRITLSFITINKNVIGKDEFKNLLELYENKRTEDIDKKFHWIKNLCWSSGRNASVWDLKTVIRSVYESELLRIKVNSNLGPALGILATFIGLGFTLFELYNSGQSFIIKSEIGGLFPVMIGGAAGIAVYASGNRFYRKAESVISQHERIYLEVFFEFDEGVRLRLSKARSIEEIYEGFLEHVTKLAGKFTDISNRYDDLNVRLKTTITSLNTTMEENLKKMDHSFGDHLRSINTKLDQYIVNLGKTNDKLLVESQEKIQNYLDKVDNTNSKFYSSMETNLARLNKSFEEYIGDFQKNKEELLKKSQKNIEKYLEKINEISKTTSKSSERLSAETRKMLDSLTGINKDFISQYKDETSKQLEFITNQANQTHNEVGTLLKTIENTYTKNLKATAQLLEKVDEYQKNLKQSSESTETLSKSLKQVGGLVEKLHNSVVLYTENIDVINKVTEKISDQNKRIDELVKTTRDRVMNIDQFVHEIKEVKDFLEHADKKAISPLTELALEIQKLPGDWIIKLTKELKEIKECIKSPQSNFPPKNPLDLDKLDDSLPSSYAAQTKSPFIKEEKEEYPGDKFEKLNKADDINLGISSIANQGQPYKREKPSGAPLNSHSPYKKREKEKSWVSNKKEWLIEKFKRIFKRNR